MNRQALIREFEANRGRYIEEWKEFVRFPSVGADPTHDRDCRDCAGWVVSHLRGIGFDARLLETGTKPLVYAVREGDPGLPVILFYGHYDVQPADPLEQWISPPFEPVMRDNRLYGRGAEDNKGQVMSVLKAMETLVAHRELKPTVKILMEGEEESGCAGITGAMPGIGDLVKADILMVADSGMDAGGAPAILMGLRGMMYLNVALGGPLRDLHSGVHGGLAPNPATAMAGLVASLHNEDGGIAVEGYYDGVGEPDRLERELAARSVMDESAYEKATGVPPVAGERHFSHAERVGFRPTIEVNGIHAGYAGPGTKTIIPARAILRLSSRLVSGQDPERCLAALVRHLERHTPPGLKLEVEAKGIAGGALRLRPDSRPVLLAKTILDDMFEKETVMRWEGASIPVIALLAEVSGAEPVMVGFGRESDNVHAPNESFSLEQFKWGYLFAGRFLAGVSEGNTL